MARSMVYFDILFKNWDNFNPPLRNRKAVPTWCRLDADILDHPALYGQSANRQLLFVYLLARATKRVGVACLTSAEIYDRCALQVRHATEALAYWQSLGILEFKVSDLRLTDRPDRQTDNYEGVTDVPDPSSQNPKRKAKPKTEKQAKESGSTMELWKVYTEVWRERYGNDPKRNAMTMGQAKQLVSRLGIEDAKEVVRFYLKQDDRYYDQQAYTLGPCLKNCEALLAKLQAETPKVITPEMYEAMGYKIIDTSQFPEEQELF